MVDEMRRELGAVELQKIAVFRALQLGDLLCTTPALRALRAAFPSAQVTLIGLPWQETLLARFPHYLDAFIPFPGHPAMPEQAARLDAIPEFFQRVQAEQFDMALQLHGSGAVSNPLVALFGAKQVAGFYEHGCRPPAYGTFIEYPGHGHEIRRLLHLLAYLGIPPQGEHLEFPVFERDRQELARWIPVERTVCLHVGASTAEKQWSPSEFAVLGDYLAGRGLQVVLTGVEADKPLTARVAGRMKYPVVDLAGKTSLGALAALIQSADLVICNDTSVSHLAAVFGTRSLILFMNSDWRRWAPLDAERHQVIRHARRLRARDLLPRLDRILSEIVREPVRVAEGVPSEDPINFCNLDG